MKPQLPGLPTFSALLLATILTAWLGLWGPIDVGKLKDWQTIMAAGIALVAGSLAYKGAMAKVDFDREIAERERISKKLGIFFRLLSVIKTLDEEASHAVEEIREFSRSFIASKRLTHFTLMLPDVAELIEAWDKIDMFPEEAIDGIYLLRNVLPRMKEELAKEAPNGQDIVAPTTTQTDMFLRAYRSACEEIISAIAGIKAAIELEISRARRFN
jgi:hypothetical protein